MTQPTAMLGDKVPRYILVSVINVPLVQLTIFLLQQLAGVSGWVANVIAITVLTGPAYLMTKAWVWPESAADPGPLVLIFWTSSVLGLILSSAFAYWLGTRIDGIWVANVASLAVYGALFVGRFFLLNRLMAPDDGA